MPLLKDRVRTLFRRRKPIEIDISDTQAGGLNGGEIGLIETKPMRPRSAAERAQDEVLALVRRIGDHLDGQTSRTERLLEVMDRLPHALDAVPEINRQNARLLEVLHEHFAQSKRREETMNAALGSLTETSMRQTDVLGLVQRHLDANGRTAATLSASLETLHRGLSDLAESNSHSALVLERISDAAAERENGLQRTLARTQRWMIVAVAFCGAASAMAIVVAVLALVQ